MKAHRPYWLYALLLPVLAFWPTVAHAQAASSLPRVSDIVAKVMIIYDSLLDYWVAGNTLTDTGDTLVGSLASIIHQLSLFVAQLYSVFPAELG